jgi:1-deoxy-D-xylulose-5-phosphate reductoisomerase
MTTTLAILGSTGSIGRQTLDVVREHPDHFRVVGLAAGGNLDLLASQAREFSPRLVCTSQRCDADLFEPCPVVSGNEGLLEIATMHDAEMIVVATSGHSAIKPTLAAMEAGKQVALANKEVVVCAGEILMRTAGQTRTLIRPIDSEHSAIWQCLASGNPEREVTRITLTASGGALRNLPIEQLGHVTVEQALAHPNWTMGPKVTIDSASLMNKGLEVIEAHWLFDVPYSSLDVVIHPQSIVHSMVTFIDGSTLAQLGVPDMRVPIQYALTYPERISSTDRHLNLIDMGTLEFYPPDLNRYPALGLARQAGEAGSTYTTVLSAADEVAVQAFIQGRIHFGEITELVEFALDEHRPPRGQLTLEAIEEADHWARDMAESRIRQSIG